MERNTPLLSGKAKSLFTTEHEEQLILHFRDDTSAFNGEKVSQLKNKGAVNNRFNAFIMEQLASAGIATHFIALLNEQDSLVKKLQMIPVECVLRNRAAGSLCRRLGVPKGQPLQPPLFEFFYKSDELGDPLISAEHILAFQWATAAEVQQMQALTLAVNQVLQPLFANAAMQLVDFKLEFGRAANGAIVLGDEFTPDGCRIWEADSQDSLDKDRFRQDLGQVVESYQRVAERLGIPVHSTSAVGQQQNH